MRILQVYKDVYPEVSGGIERYVHDLSAFLAARGHQVEILVTGGGEREVDGVPVHGVRELGRILSNPVAPGLSRALFRGGHQVVHFHLPLPSAVLAWLAGPRRRRTPWVVTYHSDIVRQAFAMPFYAPFLRRFLRGAYSVLATSRNYQATSRYLSPLGNVQVIPIGVDTGLFRPSGVPRGNYYLFVGRFRRYKGITVLLDAWKLMEDPPPLVLAGGGALEERIRRTVSQNSLPVRILSDVSDEGLRELYSGARALILPSTQRSEAFGMVQLEAMACGTPVLSSDLPTGVTWVNSHRLTGLHFTAGDPRALMEAVMTMEGSTSFREGAGKAARHRAETLFESKRLFGKVEECLKKAAGS